MRIKTFKNGGYTSGGFTSGGGTMTGPLFLAADPVGDLEATTKQYVDSKIATFDASKFTSGTLQVGRLPVFTGDVTSSSGSSNLSLANSGVSGGVFCKVTVNAKGLIIAGGSLAESDLPDLDWSKFTSGKPNTIAGYGITDGLTKAGGTVTGSLTLHADPTSANHLATKQYVDNATSSSSVLKTGDITTKMTSSTPTGFLRCNGGAVNKAAYSALYAAVGDTFYIALRAYAGLPWRQQYDINTLQSGNITGWTQTTSMTTTVSYHRPILTKNYIYCFPGNSNTFFQRAPINADGTLGAWVRCPNWVAGNGFVQTVLIKNRIYVFNGSEITYGIVNNDGSISGPYNYGTVSTGHTFGSGEMVEVIKDYLYAFSINGNGIIRAPINSDGTLGSFSSVGTTITSHNHGVIAITNTRVYLMGGHNGSQHSSIYYASINADGTLGAWVSAGNLPNNIMYAEVYVTKNTVYVIGGYDGSSYLNSVYFAPIDANGVIGGWSNGSVLPASMGVLRVVAIKNKLYLFNANGSNTVYVANISGGVNDITPHPGTSATEFRLPDLTTSDLSGSYSYIKT